MRMLGVAVASLLSLAFLASAASAGSVTGTVTYEGTVPKLPRVRMEADPQCLSKHRAPVYSDVLVLGEDNTMKYVFVQLKNAPEGGPVPSEPVVIDQVGCRYEPHVAGVMAGQTLLFKNSDRILHNVHGEPEENKEFNIGMPPTLRETDISFNKPEPFFPVKCDVHPWMKSYVAVMTHPYFAVTAADGTFTIGDVPDGTYTVEAWHERLGTQTAEVTVKDGTATADFTFSRK